MEFEGNFYSKDRVPKYPLKQVAKNVAIRFLSEGDTWPVRINETDQ